MHVFDFSGHPQATRAYAWSSPIEGSTKRRFFAVLHMGGIKSPQDAVKGGDCGGASERKMMKLSSIILALAAGTGLMAAYMWYNASNVKIDLGYIYPGSHPGETYSHMDMALPRLPEPGEAEQKQMNDISATWGAMKEAANLNKIAAKWTACSVALNALSAIISLISN